MNAMTGLLPFLAAALLAGCGGGSAVAPPSTPVTFRVVTLSTSLELAARNPPRNLSSRSQRKNSSTAGAT